jgi:hypothetical protein
MSAFEQHYGIMELARMWGVSRHKMTDVVEKYKHLIPNFQLKTRSRFGPIKGKYDELRIPKSVVELIYRDLMGGGRTA